MSLISEHDSFIHEAFLYSNDQEFFDRTVPFINDGVAAGDAILVVLTRGRIDSLRSMVSSSHETVQFQDMAEVGLNPGRIISAWVRFRRSKPDRRQEDAGDRRADLEWSQ